MPVSCREPGCTSKHKARGYCKNHYQLAYTAGKFTPNRQSTEDRFMARVDKTSTCWNWTGTIYPDGYGILQVNGTRVRAHRYSYELVNGPIQGGLILDHKCHNRRCVNPDHLREVNDKKNQENRQGAQANSRSGIRGVHWFGRLNCWRVSVQHFGKAHSGGYFKDLGEAEKSAIALRNSLYTHNDLDRTKEVARG